MAGFWPVLANRYPPLRAQQALPPGRTAARARRTGGFLEEALLKTNSQAEVVRWLRDLQESGSPTPGAIGVILGPWFGLDPLGRPLRGRLGPDPSRASSLLQRLLTRDKLCKGDRRDSALLDESKRAASTALMVLQWLEEHAGLKHSYSTLGRGLNACWALGAWEKALALLEAMVQQSIRQDTLACTCAMGTFRHSEEWAKALQLQAEMMQRRIPQNAMTFRGAMMACTNCDEWVKALELLEAMVEHSIQQDTSAYSLVIHACPTGKARELLAGMEQRSIKQDVRTFTAAISACQKFCEWVKALELLEAMVQHSVQPEADTFKEAIMACGQKSEWQQALLLFRRSSTDHIAPEGCLYNAIFNAVYALPQSKILFQEALEARAFRCLREGTVYRLDLHGCSNAAVRLTLRWWLLHAAPVPFYEDVPVLSPRLEIIAGWGAHTFSRNKKVEAPEVVFHELDRMGVPRAGTDQSKPGTAVIAEGRCL